MSAARKVDKRLARKCTRARGLMEQAQALVDEVLADRGYHPLALPDGVAPSDAGHYLESAITLLTELAPERDEKDGPSA